MEKKIKVSVVVPFYNVEEYIDKCLDSLIKQTLKDIEIILVDDGSKDRSLDIALEYERKYDNIKIYRKDNGGISSARNYGIDRAIGEYISFVDSDDYIEPEMLELMYCKANKESIDILRCEFNLVNEKNEYIRKSNNDFMLKNNILQGKEYIDKLIQCKAYTTIVWMGIYKRDLIKDYNIYFTEGRIHEEHEFMVQCIFKNENCTIMHIDTPLYNYRQRPNSLIHTGNIKSVEDVLANARDIEHKYKTFIKNEKDLKLMGKMISYLLYQGIVASFKLDKEKYNLARQKFKKEQLKKCLKYTSNKKRKFIIINYKYNYKFMYHMYYKLIK